MPYDYYSQSGTLYRVDQSKSSAEKLTKDSQWIDVSEDYFAIVTSLSTDPDDDHWTQSYYHFTKPSRPPTLEEILLEKSIKIAKEAHHGQVDKAGVDYINHPQAVASKLVKPEEQAVAWLHDTIEDTWVDEYYLLTHGIWPEIVDAVSAITKRKSEDYETYLERVKANPLARAVKIADLQHNMDLTRIEQPTQKDYDRVNKYKVALRFLNPGVKIKGEKETVAQRKRRLKEKLEHWGR